MDKTKPWAKSQTGGGKTLIMTLIMTACYFLSQLENLMSDIGGQLGLWIGVSVITCAELLKLFLDMLKVLCRKLFISNSKEVQDITLT